jgi:hypothetical protein
MPGQNIIEQTAAALANMSLDLDLKGGAVWAPARNPKGDYSRWGVCEVWLNCRIGKINECTTGPIPTGDWICWNTATGHIMGFVNKQHLSAQQQAEIFAVLQNEGKPTRVVNPFGDITTSNYTLAQVERLLGPALREYRELYENADL